MNSLSPLRLERIAGTVRPTLVQGGFSLVELMVSLAISLVILAALVALFVNTTRSNREFERANSRRPAGLVSSPPGGVCE